MERKVTFKRHLLIVSELLSFNKLWLNRFLDEILVREALVVVVPVLVSCIWGYSLLWVRSRHLISWLLAAHVLRLIELQLMFDLLLQLLKHLLLAVGYLVLQRVLYALQCLLALWRSTRIFNYGRLKWLLSLKPFSKLLSASTLLKVWIYDDVDILVVRHLYPWRRTTTLLMLLWYLTGWREYQLKLLRI